MIDVDLKEEKTFYSMPLHLLDAEQLAKAYVYALLEFGDSTRSRIILDEIRARDERYEMHEEDISKLTDSSSVSLDYVEDLENENSNALNKINKLEHEIKQLRKERCGL